MPVSIQGTIARNADPLVHERHSMDRLPNIHPGEVLLKEFLEPLRLSQNRAARDISVPPRRLNEIVHGKRRVTADTALRRPAISAIRNASGSACRPTTIWRRRAGCLEAGWNARSG